MPPLCEICRERPAQYVCQNCGARVCAECIDPHTGLCSYCQPKATTPAPIATGLPLGLKVIFLGMAMIFIGFLLLFASALLSPGTQGSVSGGAIVFIGPFPIAFGFGPYAPTLLAIGLLIATLLFFLALRRH